MKINTPSKSIETRLAVSSAYTEVYGQFYELNGGGRNWPWNSIGNRSVQRGVES